MIKIYYSFVLVLEGKVDFLLFFVSVVSVFSFVVVFCFTDFISSFLAFGVFILKFNPNFIVSIHSKEFTKSKSNKASLFLSSLYSLINFATFS